MALALRLLRKALDSSLRSRMTALTLAMTQEIVWFFIYVIARNEVTKQSHKRAVVVEILSLHFVPFQNTRTLRDSSLRSRMTTKCCSWRSELRSSAEDILGFSRNYAVILERSPVILERSEGSGRSDRISQSVVWGLVL